MYFLERESNALKSYLEKELAPICDADPKVLADYILALLKHDYPIADLRRNIAKDLTEFMAFKGFSEKVF
jgi:RNA-binding protein 26